MDISSNGIENQNGIRQPQFAKAFASIPYRHTPMMTSAINMPRDAVVWIQLTATLGMLMALRSEEHTSELQSRGHLVCRLLLEKKNSWTWNLSSAQGIRP